MRILIDENMSAPRLAFRLQAAGHDVVMAGDVGLASARDPRVLTWAAGQDRVVLTQDHDDFTDLHELILACGGHHPGILTVRFDNDPHHNLTERGIVTAVGKLESSGVPIPDQVHVLNHWR
jgi:predicted nuclease of predicted toxin-antitoxin system